MPAVKVSSIAKEGTILKRSVRRTRWLHASFEMTCITDRFEDRGDRKFVYVLTSRASEIHVSHGLLANLRVDVQSFTCDFHVARHLIGYLVRINFRLRLIAKLLGWFSPESFSRRSIRISRIFVSPRRTPCYSRSRSHDLSNFHTLPRVSREKKKKKKKIENYPGGIKVRSGFENGLVSRFTHATA